MKTWMSAALGVGAAVAVVVGVGVAAIEAGGSNPSATTSQARLTISPKDRAWMKANGDTVQVVNRANSGVQSSPRTALATATGGFDFVGKAQAASVTLCRLTVPDMGKYTKSASGSRVFQKTFDHRLVWLVVEHDVTIPRLGHSGPPGTGPMWIAVDPAAKSVIAASS